MKQKYLCFILLVFTLPADQLVVQRYLATIIEPFQSCHVHWNLTKNDTK
jgi:hypothetical protein